MAYSENTLNQIRERVDIVELVSEYVQLKKSGQGYMGLCPFHGEKTPSFHVHPLKQCFHCFGCQKGGNVFTFLSAIEGLNFPEAVQRLAKRTGVELKEDSSFRRNSNTPMAKPNERLISALELATKYFQFLLLEKKEYKFALDYITGRGISRKTIEKFRIGVSPSGWTILTDFLVKRGFNHQELVACGLLIEKEDKRYDRFRKRLMFPITNKEGDVIAFGARILDEQTDRQPKYLNSSESVLFSKRKNLYGLFENQRGIRLRGEAVIVEGYMDVVGLFEAGVTNAVATMGTALTEEHCREMKALTKTIVTVFDADRAGNDAWHRSVHLFINEGLFAKDLSLPHGLDPDEFVLKEGAETFFQLCDKAPRQITKYLKEIASKGALSATETSKYLGELAPILRATKRLPDRAMLWDQIALVLKVSIEALKELIADPLQKETATGMQKSPKIQARIAAKPPSIDIVDLEFLTAAVAEPDLFLGLPKDRWAKGIKGTQVLHWLSQLADCQNKQEFESRLEALIHSEPGSHLASYATAGLFREEKKSTPGLLEAVLARVEKRKKEHEIKALSAEIKLAEKLGEEPELLRLLERLKTLRSTP